MINNPADLTRLLVVTGDPSVLRPLCSLKEANGWQLDVAANVWDATDRVQSGVALDLLLLEIPGGDGEGMHILHWLRRLRPALPIVLIGRPDDVDMKRESIRVGARDYLTKPIDDDQLEIVVRRNLSAASTDTEAEVMSDDVEQVSNGAFFIGISPVMRKLRAQAALLAEVDNPVLILGEDGSGKETTARLVHRLSVRSGFEFAKVNCGALPEELLERELFGYEKNGTSLPPRIKPGKLERCAKGTILLDQITELPLGLQSKLLTALQTKRFLRPGTSTYVEVDVRVLAATSPSVDRAMAEKKLQEDFYRHLRPYTIHVPPLRERKEELPFLSHHFMHRLAKQFGLSPRAFSPAILQAWEAYHWPGNLRELEHFVKRYLMVGDKELAFERARPNPDGEAQGASVSSPRKSQQLGASASERLAGVSDFKSLRSLLQSVKSETERNAIAMALEKTGWNRKAAARALKVSYRSLLYKIEQYHMVSSNSALLPPGKGPRNTATEMRSNCPSEWAQLGK